MLHIIRDKAQSFGIKIVFGIIIVVFVFWGVGNFSAGGNNVVATVNGDPISLQAYGDQLSLELRSNQQLSAVMRDKPALQEDFKRYILESLIGAELLKQEAKRMGIVVTPQELYQDISAQPYFQNALGKFDKELYKSALASQNYSPALYEDERKNELIIKKLLGYVLGGTGVSDEETRLFFDFEREERKADYILFPVAEYQETVIVEEKKEYYEQNKDQFKEPGRVDLSYILLTPDSLAASYPADDLAITEFYEKNQDAFKEPLQFNVSQILLNIPQGASSDDKAAIRKRIEEVRNRVTGGDDFAQAARVTSDDKETSLQGGELGWVTKDELIPLIVSSLEVLKPGEITEVLELPDRFVMLKMLERKEESIKALSESKEDIAKHLSVENVQKAYKAIEELAETGLRDGKNIVTMADEFKVNLEKSGLIALEEVQGKLGLSESPVDTLKVVGAGKIVPVPLPVKDGIALVQVDENIAEGIPAYEILEERITLILADKKASLKARDDAAKLLATIKTSNDRLPEKYQGRLKTSERSLRASPNGILDVKPLGNVPQLVNDLFTHPKGEWLPTVYDVDNGVVVVRVGTIAHGSEEEWKTTKDMYADGLQNRRRMADERGFMQALLSRSKVTENFELLKRIPLY